jgi:hypothetical protein
MAAGGAIVCEAAATFPVRIQGLRVQVGSDVKSRVCQSELIGRLPTVQQSERTDPTRNPTRTCRFCRMRSVGLDKVRLGG